MSITCHLLICNQLIVNVNIVTTSQKSMEQKFQDLKVYITEKLINEDVKLKEICSSLLEEVKTNNEGSQNS